MSLLIAFGLARLAPLMEPIKRGTAEELWEQACHLSGRELTFLGHGEVYKPREGWFVYDIQHWHGSDLYRVPEAEVLASFDKLVEKLRVNKDNPNIYSHARVGFERWSNSPDASKHNPDGLLAEIRKAYLDEQKDNLSSYSEHEFEAFLVSLRWARNKWYWANIVFEWLFLSGLVLFAAWPMLRRKGWRCWAIHLGMLPMLFLLPVYLGYATFSFTSAGPTGGVLYPWLLMNISGGSCNSFDRQILAYTPKILEPLSAPIGSPLVLSGRGMPGPTTMAIAGLIIVAVIFAGHKPLHRLQQDAVRAGKISISSPFPECQSH
jgi:hypothetical protein